MRRSGGVGEDHREETLFSVILISPPGWSATFFWGRDSLDREERSHYATFLLYSRHRGFSLHLQGGGDLGWETVVADPLLCPGPSSVRPVPYLHLTGGASLDDTLGGEVLFNSGLLYLDGVSIPSYYRERRYLQDLYARIQLPPLEIGLGWYPQILAQGRITSADNPGIYLRFRPTRSLLLEGGEYRVVLSGLTYTAGSPQALYGFARLRLRTLSLEGGVLWLKDRSSSLRELFEPLAPIVVRRLCRELTPLQCARLIERVIENKGYLLSSRTTLYNPWLHLHGYIGAFEFYLQGIFQGGSTVLTDLRMTPHPMTHSAYLFEGELRHVGERWELALLPLLFSGGPPLKPYYHTFLGIQTFYSDTLLFFSQGVRQDLVGSLLIPSGSLGFGVRALILRGDLFPDPFEPHPYAALLYADQPLPGRSETFYGWEVGGELSYGILPFLSLGLRGAWLGGGDFPIVPIGETGFLGTQLLSPSPLWFGEIFLRFEGEGTL